MVVERLEDLAVAVLAAQRVEEHDCPVHLGIDVDRGHRDQVETFVIDLGQLLGDYLAE